ARRRLRRDDVGLGQRHARRCLAPAAEAKGQAMNAIAPVYRPKEAAALLKISKATLFRYIAAGRLATRKIGPNVTVILAEDLAAFRAGDGASMQPGCIAAHHTAEVRHNQVANALRGALSPDQRPHET